MDRRNFLIRAGVIGCSAAASPLMTPVTFANAPWDNRLVVIILRGAMDGLDVVRPVGDPNFKALRPKLNAEGDAYLLDHFFALHSGLSPLTPLWEKGELAFAHAVSTPYRDRRSHFDGQDLLEAGTPGLDGPYGRDGWINRLLTQIPGASAETAFAVGADPLPIMNGSALVSRWSPEANLDLSPQALRLLELTYHDDPLFRETLFSALDIVDGLPSLEEEGNMGGTGRSTGQGSHLSLAHFAASRLREDTRIAAFSLNGWDTHRNQQNLIRRPLTQLSEMILSLKQELGPIWGKTMVLAVTEFGRTARENGTGGTDHGTGGAMVMAGGSLKAAKVFTDWPGLDERDLYARRDLMPTRDVRAYAAWAMRGLFGLDTSLLETTVFPGLDLGSDPGLTA